MDVVRSSVGRLGLAVAVSAAALACATLPAPATAAAGYPSVARNTVVETEKGTTLTLAVVGISRARPVTVRWGEGRKDVLRSTCSTARAVARPQSCAATGTHTYGEAGTFEVTVRVRAAAPIFTTQVTSSGGGPVADPSEWQREMLGDVNALRAKAGADPVRLCAALNRSAQAYAQLMGERNHFDHHGPDGSSPGDRMEAAGYEGVRAWGENIAAGQTDVAEVMAAWRDSPGHYTNIVEPRFTHLGVGFATVEGSEYSTYWAQNFGAGGTC